MVAVGAVLPGALGAAGVEADPAVNEGQVKAATKKAMSAATRSPPSLEWTARY